MLLSIVLHVFYISTNYAVANIPALELQTCNFTLKQQLLILEIAKSKHEKARGLMNRHSLPQDHGMLFIFTPPKRLSFWMKNTYIPLDIAYLDKDMQIQEMYSMQPLNTHGVKSKSHKIMYALELNNGWFKKHNVQYNSQLKPAKKSENSACQFNKNIR